MQFEENKIISPDLGKRFLLPNVIKWTLNKGFRVWLHKGSYAIWTEANKEVFTFDLLSKSELLELRDLLKLDNRHSKIKAELFSLFK